MYVHTYIHMDPRCPSIVSDYCVQAYDGHLNMVLSDVEETVTIVEVEEDNQDPAVRVISRLNTFAESICYL